MRLFSRLYDRLCEILEADRDRDMGEHDERLDDEFVHRDGIAGMALPGWRGLPVDPDPVDYENANL